MELAVDNIIKMVLGILLLVVIAFAIYFFFGKYVINYFKGIFGIALLNMKLFGNG